MTDLTEGLRIYAIGDIHGRLDLLTEMLARIRADLAARPHPRPLVIFLGDYVDRGPGEPRRHRGADRAQGVRRCRRGSCSATTTATSRPTCATRTGTTAPTTGSPTTWAATRRSPPTACRTPAAQRPAATRDAFAAAFPPEHLAFLDACELAIRLGGYLFVHAGIRPGVPLAAQDPRRPDLDPRALPDLDRRLRLQGRARPHHRAGGRAPPEPHRRRHRRGPHRRPLLPACSRATDVALLEPGGPRPWPRRLRPAELAHPLAPALTADHDRRRLSSLAARARLPGEYLRPRMPALRGVAQSVEHRSPKPRVVGSSPIAPASMRERLRRRPPRPAAPSATAGAR